MPTYNQAALQADLAAIEHALASDDTATIVLATQRARTLLNSAGSIGAVVNGRRSELASLLERCLSELSGHSTAA